MGDLNSLILSIRGARVMLSQSLADLYDVEPRALIQAVKRNLTRFPADFLFQLTPEETGNLKSQFVISSWGGSRTPPYAFTEQGVAMLSSVLKSERAIQANIAIMRTFVELRRSLTEAADPAKAIVTVFNDIHLIARPPRRRRRQKKRRRTVEVVTKVRA